MNYFIGSYRTPAHAIGTNIQKFKKIKGPNLVVLFSLCFLDQPVVSDGATSPLTSGLLLASALLLSFL